MAEGRVIRKFLASLSMLCVLGQTYLPAEHLHTTQTRDGHHPDVIHRHFEPHHPIGPETTISGEEGRVQWLDDSSFTSPRPAPHIYSIDRALGELPPVAPPEQASRWTGRTVHVSVHDPPWARSHGLRAPPLLFL